jgi:predicted GNAT family acetyltransferase
MANYTYTKTRERDQAVFTIYSGAQQVARARFMIPTQDFESYAVSSAYRGRGLSYALTYAMLAYCVRKNHRRPQVTNAHGALLHALPQVGFQQIGPTRLPGRREESATFRCNSRAHSMALCQAKMAAYGLTLAGPVDSGRCVIL